MGRKKSAIASQTHSGTRTTLPGPPCGTDMGRSAPEAVGSTCAVGSGVSGGRRRSLGWRQGGCGSGRIRRIEGETDGCLPCLAGIVLLVTARLRAARLTGRAH